ncbi:MAG: IS110 family transposase [Acidobacteriota bacterium]
MRATRNDSTGSSPVLYMAYDLGWTSWKLGFGVGRGHKPRCRTIRARDLEQLEQEIAAAKKRFKLPKDASVMSCYEAGRDGWWLHRYLESQGILNLVVDSSSIEVNRRQRRAKSDGLDTAKLLMMLMRYANGDSEAWSVVRPPRVEDEDDRQLHRELLSLKSEQTRHVNRIKGLLAGWGLQVTAVQRLPQVLSHLQTWDGGHLPPQLRQRLLREWERLQLVQRQIGQLERERLQVLRESTSRKAVQMRTLMELRGIGVNSAWLYVMEIFGWREIRNRRELASLCGLAPTPNQSGTDDHEQGISKAGNWRMRRMAVEIAWCWLRWQPQSELSQWFEQRFGAGGKRTRRVGIVAVARKLLVQLWRYLETGELPAGAVLKPEAALAPAAG